MVVVGGTVVVVVGGTVVVVVGILCGGTRRAYNSNSAASENSATPGPVLTSCSSEKAWAATRPAASPRTSETPATLSDVAAWTAVLSVVSGEKAANPATARRATPAHATNAIKRTSRIRKSTPPSVSRESAHARDCGNKRRLGPMSSERKPDSGRKWSRFGRCSAEEWCIRMPEKSRQVADVVVSEQADFRQ